MLIKSAEFIKSATDVSNCPKNNLPEYAFIGRSNVGKSSLINMLVNKKNLAKTSTTPGKTQFINYFLINSEFYFVDLPGYGFAKVSKQIKEKWEGMIKNYILKREKLAIIFILIDSRIEPQQSDLRFLEWLGKNKIKFVLLYTKADKLKKQELRENILSYKTELEKYWKDLPLAIITSSELKTGKEKILELLTIFKK
ncbi:MAG: ribosome biogenesis GTP-binding protein YihA/YsxC [Bacteroidales bacterium]|nr:ribosome biogenesis GTP-binding protein YihA/YsxC [Bacteroidales bacterium]